MPDKTTPKTTELRETCNVHLEADDESRQNRTESNESPTRKVRSHELSTRKVRFFYFDNLMQQDVRCRARYKTVCSFLIKVFYSLAALHLYEVTQQLSKNNGSFPPVGWSRLVAIAALLFGLSFLLECFNKKSDEPSQPPSRTSLQEVQNSSNVPEAEQSRIKDS